MLSRLRDFARWARQALRTLNEIVEDAETILKIVAIVALVVLYVAASINFTSIEAFAAQAWQTTLQMLHHLFPFVP